MVVEKAVKWLDVDSDCRYGIVCAPSPCPEVIMLCSLSNALLPPWLPPLPSSAMQRSVFPLIRLAQCCNGQRTPLSTLPSSTRWSCKAYQRNWSRGTLAATSSITKNYSNTADSPDSATSFALPQATICDCAPRAMPSSTATISSTWCCDKPEGVFVLVSWVE